MERCAKYHRVLTTRQFLLRLILVSLLLVQMHIVGAVAAESAPNGSVAASVNGTVISVHDFKRERDRILRQKGKGALTSDEAAQSELKRMALENIIIRELLYQESVKQKISVAASSIDREIEQLKGKFTTNGQYVESLQRIDMTELLMREQVARGLATTILIDRLGGKAVTATEEEVKKYYERHLNDFTRQPQVRISHILVAIDSEWPKYNKKEAGEKLSILRKRVMGGENFASLAAANSDCQSKTKGGDIGWFAPGQLTPEMEKGVALLKIGEVSEIIEDKFGLHLIKVAERKDAFTTPVDAVRDKIRNLVRQENNLTLLQHYVKGLRDAATVEIHLMDE